MSKKPVICLTVRGKPFDEARREPTTAPFEWITNAYSAGIVRAGGVPVLLSNECPVAEIGRMVRPIDGLFLTGGEDVHPRHFGEEAAVDNLLLNELRDNVEVAAIAAADSAAMPILGVCRGIQVLNIARGGTIYQDLKAQYLRPVRDHSRGPSRVDVQTHAIRANEGSRLAAILKTTSFSAATDHHQALRDLGRGLEVVAHSPEDGVIEAVEESGNRFVVAVQWHPEVRPDDEATQRLFRAFVEAASQYAAAR